MLFRSWECLPLENPLQELCVRDGGFNFQLFKAGKFSKRDLLTGEETGEMRVVRSRYPLPSGHRVDPQHLLADIRAEVATGKLLRASALAVRERESRSDAADSDLPPKLPSDNHAALCHGLSTRRTSTNNLSLAEVSSQIEAARQTWDGSDFEPWPTNRNTNVEVSDLPPAACEQKATVKISFSAGRKVGSVQDVPRRESANAQKLSIHQVNQQLQALSSGLQAGPCCGNPQKEVRNIGRVHWNQCLNCGSRSNSWILRSRGHKERRVFANGT